MPPCSSAAAFDPKPALFTGQNKLLLLATALLTQSYPRIKLRSASSEDVRVSVPLACGCFTFSFYHGSLSRRRFRTVAALCPDGFRRGEVS